MTTPHCHESATSDLTPSVSDGHRRDAGVLSPRYRWVTMGIFLLVMLDAFVALAVSTIMPPISAELHGAGLYAFAFAGPVAVSVIGMALAGIWSDRGNPRSALFVSVVVFASGLIVVALAPSMVAFVSGRLVHGLAGGAITVALYVIVARVYPQALHARVFAAFATAWVIPSLVGPAIAGVLAETVGWRWVFIGVVAFVSLATPMVVPAMRDLHAPADPTALGLSRRVADDDPDDHETDLPDHGCDAHTPGPIGRANVASFAGRPARRPRQAWPFCSGKNRSSIGSPNTDARRNAKGSEGSNLPLSIEMTVCRETPSSSASRCCDHSRDLRVSAMMFRTSPPPTKDLVPE